MATNFLLSIPTLPLAAQVITPSGTNDPDYDCRAALWGHRYLRPKIPYTTYSAPTETATLTLDLGVEPGEVTQTVAQHTTTEYFTRADHNDLSIDDNAATIVAWARATSLATTRCILSKWTDTGSNREYQLIYNSSDNVWRFRIRDSTLTYVNCDSSVTPEVGPWIFFVCKHDPTGNTLSIQLNNGTVESVAHANGVDAKAGVFHIGKYAEAPNPGWVGQTAAVAKWSRLLTAGELTWLYNNGAPRDYSEIAGGQPALTTNLNAWYQLDESSDGTGTVQRNDDGPNGLHLTDVNTTPSATGTFDQLSAVEESIDHVIISRADILRSRGVESVDINGSDDGSAWSQVKTYDIRRPTLNLGGADYLTCADDSAFEFNETFYDYHSLMCWVRFGSIAADQTILSKWTTSGNQRQWKLWYDQSTGKLTFTVSTNGTATAEVTDDSAFTVTVGVWYMIVIAHDAVGNTISIRHDLGGVTSLGHAGGVYGGGTSAFFVGKQDDATPEYFTGRIGPVAKWYKALTTAEINWLYFNGRGRYFSEIGKAGSDGEDLYYDSVADQYALSFWYDMDEESAGSVAAQRSDLGINMLHLTDSTTVPSVPTTALDYYGPQNAADMLDTFATSTAYRYWQIEIVREREDEGHVGKFSFGTAFDMGCEPNRVLLDYIEEKPFITEGGATRIQRSAHIRRKITVQWMGVTDAKLQALVTALDSCNARSSVFVFTRTTHNLLDGDRIIHCKVLDIKTPRIWDDYNEVEVTFEELLG